MIWVNKLDYEYIYAPDVFGDDNRKLKYGVQEINDLPAYIEWFKTLEELEKNTKKYRFNVLNRDHFLGKHGYFHVTINEDKR